ncbi:hypothetical protein FB107DRAFT_244176 [Schizophyllum commune]
MAESHNPYYWANLATAQLSPTYSPEFPDMNCFGELTPSPSNPALDFNFDVAPSQQNTRTPCASSSTLPWPLAAPVHPSHAQTFPPYAQVPHGFKSVDTELAMLNHPVGASCLWGMNGHYPQMEDSMTLPYITGPGLGFPWDPPEQHPSPVMSQGSDGTLVGDSPPAGSPSSSGSSLPASPAAIANDAAVASPQMRFPRAIVPPSIDAPQGRGCEPGPSSSRQDFDNAPTLPMRAAGPFIPQRMYTPTTRADRQRYVEEVSPEKSIYFWNKDGESCGITLTQAFARAVHQLEDPDEYIFNGVRPSVSIRLEWPGYRSWTKQIPAKDFKKVPSPITREKLAKEVAKCVKRFIENQRPLPNDEANKRWRVGGANGIKFEDLILVSMHHVSRGSWQPQLRLRSPRT